MISKPSPAEAFKKAVKELLDARIKLLSSLTFESAGALPQGQAEDVLITGREAQLTIYRQTNPPNLPGAVLVTVQLARFGMGGVTSFKQEKGLVFSPGHAAREATTDELLGSGGGT